MTFAMGGIGAWMPTYVLERQGMVEITDEAFQQWREGPEPFPDSVLASLQQFGTDAIPYKQFNSELKKRLSKTEYVSLHERIVDAACTPSLAWINTVFGAIVVISGLTATLLGGIAGDRLRSRFSGSYFLVSGISMIIAFPAILLVIWTPFPLAWAMIFLAVFFIFFNTGPTNTILANVTHPAIRSTAFAVNIFVIHAFGDAISPVIIGRIADRTSFDRAFGIVSVIVLVGGVLWLWGVPYLGRDTALAPTRLRVD
jgi:MFS family permease